MFDFIHKKYPDYEVKAITRESAFFKIRELIKEKRDFNLDDKEEKSIVLVANKKDIADPRPTIKYIKD